jgi:hypothetical protein
VNRSGTRGPDPIRALAVAAVYLVCLLGVLAAVHPVAATSKGSKAQSARPSATTPTTTSAAQPRRSKPSALATTTTVASADPGQLPQTNAQPTTDTAAFRRHARALWKAVVDDDPDEARSAFFPRSAYVQIKAISDPAADWTNRLLGELATDVHALHAQLGADAADATLVGLVVPDGQAQWIQPGVESNSGSYWRVYGSVLRYRVPDGSEHDLPVTSLISWRGEWYVVHLGAIR